MQISLSLNAVLDRIDYSTFEGELGVRNVTGVASLEDAQRGDASFVASAKYLEDLKKSEASLVVLSKDLEAEPRPGQLFLRVDNPSIEIAKLCELISQRMWVKPEAGIHQLSSIDPTAEVDPSACIEAFVTIGAGARVGAGCVISSGCFIGPACELGDDCYLGANVTLERDTVIGKRVRIHSGVVLGSDGFGYEFEGGRHRKVPQVGSVFVGDDVEIGANTTVDRGRFGPTRIGEGSKIDNLVQIGHNVTVGKHNILCAQVGIAGSTKLGDYVVMGGRAGASGHIEIGSGAQLAGQCVAFSDLEGGAKYGGAPAIPLVAYQRITVITRRLPELFKRLTQLEKQLLRD
ncbi:UDP-3-O-(3-hydroxymyristoyl)glucosamine N-acyltransferase [Pelagicoccus sp. NFK12]|uniref:UDP-3-O-acylglucosamine N-acyltransferase n=1 Tax=Pelagicoccus enzymogenes TaxID=2773457 RepID=A0A927F6R4_9BACT|nr:UDP-3-O-(3-hydroxymyristoyl)glucosamine N-acyltransferase [Pelagicoccus enzymogenes]MBD5778205.1 UDP-3-O-(3-hydroxymyristoyl)glucosamine N-acyltransferase [Pelagicoccus enzymogenes]MDQ8201138.1 UDP-3-O-(3-hydroxymyristoyl)glucosamine N-acyltransferase [Pelagicoccus enzymogenes]